MSTAHGACSTAHTARPARRTQLNAEDPAKPKTLYDLPAEGEPWLNRYSSMLTRNKKQGASQANSKGNADANAFLYDTETYVFLSISLLGRVICL